MDINSFDIVSIDAIDGNKWNNDVEEAVKDDDIVKIMLYIENPPKPEERFLYSDIDHVLVCASVWNKTEIAKLALDMGANANVNPIRRDSPLASAVRQNNYELVEYMIHKGATLDCTVGLCDTLTGYAQHNCSKELHQLLLEHSVDTGRSLDR